MRKDADRVTNVMVSAAEVSDMFQMFVANDGSDGANASSKSTATITAFHERAMKASTEDTPAIHFSEAVAALRQIEVERKHSRTTMLSKRVYDGEQHGEKKKSKLDVTKARTRCLACWAMGHWSRYNHECNRLMDHNKANERKETSSNAGGAANWKEGGRSAPRPLFR